MPPPTGTLVHELSQNWLGKADIAVQTVLLAIGFVAVSLRLWSRRLLGVSWQGNDYLIGAAMVRKSSPALPCQSILTSSAQIFMVGRYTVELTLILLCGMGLHAAEVASVGGPDLFVQFDQVVSNFHSDLSVQKMGEELV